MRRMLYLNDEFWNKLKTKAKEKGMKVSEYVRYVLMKYWGE